MAEQDGRRIRGERSRAAILEQAVSLASAQGLDGLTLSRLAAATGLSKSGIFAHWRDKEQLQLDAVEWAEQQWVRQVILPGYDAPKGVRRLLAVHEARLRFYADEVLPGGCFFLAAQAEFDDHPGPVRDRIALAMRGWVGQLERLITEAVKLGELDPGTDAAQLAYEIDALGASVVSRSRLLGGDACARYARRAVLLRLRSLSPVPSLLPEN